MTWKLPSGRAGCQDTAACLQLPIVPLQTVTVSGLSSRITPVGGQPIRWDVLETFHHAATWRLVAS